MDIYKIHCGCQICGTGAPRWTWNATGIFALHACYNCYSTRHLVDDSAIEKDIYKQTDVTHKDHFLYFSEFNRLKRKYVRDIRAKNGVIDPEITCRFCKQSKSIFEFECIPERMCYECLDFKQYTKPCPWCGKRVNRELLLGDKSCPDCEAAVKKGKFDRLEQEITDIPKWICINTLKRRNITVTAESIEFIKQMLIAKRIKKILNNSRRKYESDYADVYGKQRPNEKNYEGRVSD